MRHIKSFLYSSLRRGSPDVAIRPCFHRGLLADNKPYKYVVKDMAGSRDSKSTRDE